jgi:hypothetical protein
MLVIVIIVTALALALLNILNAIKDLDLSHKFFSFFVYLGQLSECRNRLTMRVAL